MTTTILCDFCNQEITTNEQRYHVQLMEMSPDGGFSTRDVCLSRDVCRDCFYHLSRILRMPIAKVIFALNKKAGTA